MATKKGNFNTLSVHAGTHPDPLYGAVSTPIYQTSTFAFDSVDQGAGRFKGSEPGFIYSRLGNPTVSALEEAVASMENGHAGIATSSGMAAVVTVFLAYLEAGGHLVGTDSVYGPSRVVVEKHFKRFGVMADFVDSSNPENVRAAMRPETRLVYIETPENPTIKLSDIRRCAEIAHEGNALLVVDNTFATPILQRPLELGADIVVHSMTKFLNGHADVVAGMIVTVDEEKAKWVRGMLQLHGGCIDPHQAWLVHRGIKTLNLRVKMAQANAGLVANLLREHPAIDWVRYPGSDDHPQRELVERQMDGPGSLLCFGVKGGLEGGRVVMERVQLATLAVSLGGVETLIQHPASMTHACMTQEEREAAGITDNLVRLSVGCEDPQDIVSDLEQALDAVPVGESPELVPAG